MNSSGNRPDDQSESRGEVPEGTADRIEEWLRSLRAQRASAASGAEGGRSGRSGAATPAEDPAEAFLRAARRLAASPRAQQALARRLTAAEGAEDDPALRALARVLQSLGEDLARVVNAMGGPPGGGAAILDRPEVTSEPKLDDTDGGGGDDLFDEDDDDGDGGDDEPWPSAFIGYRAGIVDAVDVGVCRDGCCTGLFVEHPGLRAAVWFPTETAGALAEALGDMLAKDRGDAANLGVPAFGAGGAPSRGQIQATIQFFTDDIHLDPADGAGDRKQGGFARFTAYDQSLGHGGPPLVDVLLTSEQARALRRAFRRAARNAAKE